MKCPLCNSENTELVHDDFQSVFCRSCFNEWIPKQQAEIESLRKENAELKRENKILKLRCNGSLANNLCPDHRDKQGGKPCLACTIETLERENSERNWPVGPPQGG